MNVYEAVDVLALIQDETYENLRLMVKDALYLRSDNVHSFLPFSDHRISRVSLLVLPKILWIIYSKRFVGRVFIDLSSLTITSDLLGCSL